MHGAQKRIIAKIPKTVIFRTFSNHVFCTIILYPNAKFWGPAVDNGRLVFGRMDFGRLGCNPINPIEEKSKKSKKERKEASEVIRLIFGQNKVFTLFFETKFTNAIY